MVTIVSFTIPIVIFKCILVEYNDLYLKNDLRFFHCGSHAGFTKPLKIDLLLHPVFFALPYVIFLYSSV